jgi:hypothetical protein
MTVQPRSGLHIALQDTGADDLRLEVVELLQMIHFYVRQTVIDWWFKYGQIPPTWVEVERSQSDASTG